MVLDEGVHPVAVAVLHVLCKSNANNNNKKKAGVGAWRRRVGAGKAIRLC